MTLHVQNLSITLPPGGDRALAASDVSFQVKEHEILCLVGESGSGKSVIAQAIMGLLPGALRLSGGKILLEGEELTASFCRTDPDIALQFARVTFLSDVRAEVPKLRSPALIVQCNDDIIAPVQVGPGGADPGPSGK